MEIWEQFVHGVLYTYDAIFLRFFYCRQSPINLRALPYSLHIEGERGSWCDLQS